MIWKDYFYDKENIEEYKSPIFKSKKTNLPKNSKTPEELKIFLGAVKSEIMDRYKNNCNISPDLLKALLQLVKLQRDRVIVIKRCDKGAGIIILDFDEYMRKCCAHLGSKLKMKNGSTQEYYTKVDTNALHVAKAALKSVLEEGLGNQIITKQEFEAMDPEGTNPAKFYCTFKVHKDHEEMKAPPERPIVSACGSVMEQASQFVDHHIKQHGTQHESYIEDTPDFLRHLENINNEGKLPENALLVTWNVIGLFTNIPHNEGINSVRRALNEREEPKTVEQEVPTEYIIRILEIILENNILEFD